MCGIAGIIAPFVLNRQALTDMAEAMARTLYHRGPDSHGVWVDPQHQLALSHRRLSIQDLSSAGHQPMSSASGRFHLVFNGEIYNFKHLSQKLQQIGWRFQGHSDTEVLLTAIEQWGVEKAIGHCNGMFAFAVWDRQEQELILCRDRMGEKPLFFGWIDKCFVFASELKAFKKIFSGALAIDDNSQAAFFRFGYVPTPYSIYKNIYKLMPGTYLRIPLAVNTSPNKFNPLPDKTCFSPIPYWALSDVSRPISSSIITDEQEAVIRFDSLLHDVIAEQKIADVPLGTFLSGGVDSSLISAILQKVSDRPVQTFTIGFTEKEFDEAPYARAIARHIGSDHQEYYVSADDGLALVEDIPFYWDEPFADSSQIPSLLVAKMARKKVTVCLTGDGGDELFCGYNRYFASIKLWSIIQNIPHALRKLMGKSLLMIPEHCWQQFYTSYKRLMNDTRTQSNIGLKIQKMAGLMCAESMPGAYRYLMSYWHDPGNVVNYHQEAFSIIDREPDPMLGDFIHDAMYWDQLGYLVDDNLVKGDRSSMAFSLETRLPFLDRRIVEFSWQLPLVMKYQNGKSKWLLRKVLSNYVPDSLINRPKMGFSVPIRDWLKGPLKIWASDLIHSEYVSVSETLNGKNIKRVWNEHQKGSHDHSHKLWTLCMWLAWVRYGQYSL